ncbi:MAG: hypothetical protein CSB47_00880 [Proteobacteria bacterium]|nr:MAG: hypothetical protein CSB47_00880 [Pseudomonadota bacterium]
MIRLATLILAYFFLALAVIGIFLPGLPTVPFLLLAVWCAARGSKSLHRWIYAHPHLGKLLTDWEQQQAIPRKAKVIAVLMLICSWCFLFFQLDNRWLFTGITVMFLIVASFLISRPEPVSDR